MRILHILDHSIPRHSRYAIRTQAILKHQRALGWETSHLTGPAQGPALANEEMVDGWEFNRTAPPGGILEDVPVLAEIERMGEITFRIEKIVRRFRPHILHAHSPVLNVIPALRAGTRSGTPVVYEVRAICEDIAAARGTMRGGGLRYRLMRGLETWALKRADAVTTICDGLGSDIVARGIQPEKMTLVPDAVNIDEFVASGAPNADLKRRLGLDGALVLGFVGSFYEYEGLALLLRALPEILLNASQVRVMLVGDGPQERALQQLAADLGIADKVVFAARVSQEDVPRYYDLIDLFVCPRLSIRHTELVTPIRLLEAMARGCLLAASDVGGHRELVRNGETGILFRAGETAALVAEVMNLINAPDRWPVLKAAARHFVETERTWAASVARYESAYTRVMTQSWSK